MLPNTTLIQTRRVSVYNRDISRNGNSEIAQHYTKILKMPVKGKAIPVTGHGGP
jgi:hypothetical protein